LLRGETALQSSIELHDLVAQNLPEPVPYALIAPPDYERSARLPLCLMLMGGGGSRQNLVDSKPLFDAWWSEGAIPPMVIATPSPGMSYYLEDPLGGIRWDSFLANEFVPHLRDTCNVDPDRRSTAITGISVGGYGALKTAFAHPGQFGIVAAMQPMLEPGLHESEVGARNRLHHVAGGPRSWWDRIATPRHGSRTTRPIAPVRMRARFARAAWQYIWTPAMKIS
jgi:enterochelin esterase-like enzyme